MILVQTAPKAERLLRAYLNTDKPPKGFKGNPLQHKNGVVFEADVSEHNLARYAFCESLFAAAENVFPFLLGKPPVPELFDAEMLEELRSFSHRLHSGGPVFFELDTAMLSVSMQHADAETASLANGLMKNLLSWWVESHEDMVFLLMRNDLDGYLLPVSRYLGSPVAIINVMLENLMSEYTRDIGLPDSEHRALQRRALELLFVYILRELFNYGPGYLRQNEGDCNSLGRLKFGCRELFALNYMRRIMFRKPYVGSELAMILRQIRGHEAAEALLKDGVADLLHLHARFSFRAPVELCGTRFTVEGSPFAEKPIDQPIGNFSIQIYPECPGIRKEMAAIGDPSFEHADGAVATARLDVSGKELLVEEIQSDPDALLVRDKKSVSAGLFSMLASWEEIALGAVRLFAESAGFGRFFVSTPLRLFRRYAEPASFHPVKARIYFHGMERLGGRLVHDDLGDLSPEKEHWFEFSV